MKGVPRNNYPEPHSQWPPDDLEAVPACPVCQSEQRELLHRRLTDKIFFSASGEWSMYRCVSCASAYLDPRPTPDSIGRAYRNYFTHATADDSLPSGYVGRLRRIFANGYRNWRYGTRDFPASSLGVLVAAVLRSQRLDSDAGMRHLPKVKPGQRLLDVGCGNGAFLLRARSAGWDAVGVDFDPQAVAAARRQGLDVRLGGAEAIDAAVDRFDVITLAHVIEHVHQPVEVMRACRRLLKPGGWLWIDTPNTASEGHRLFGENWRGLEPPRHLVLFTPDSLDRALRTAGFGDIQVLGHRPLCGSIFRASAAIAAGIDPYSKEAGAVVGKWSIRSAERTARRDPARREFITVRAWVG